MRRQLSLVERTNSRLQEELQQQVPDQRGFDFPPHSSLKIGWAAEPRIGRQAFATWSARGH